MLRECKALLRKKKLRIVNEVYKFDVTLWLNSLNTRAVFKELSERKVFNVFSVGFREAKYNKGYYAAPVAKHIGSTHHALEVS